MNKFKILVLSIIVFLFSGIMEVKASNAYLSVSSEDVYVGDSFTVFVNIDQSAAWNIQVNSSGPVADCVIKDADATKDALNTSKQLSVSCTATQEGKITINLSGDVTNALDGNYVDIVGTKVVNVTQKPTQLPSNQTSNNSQPNNSQSNNFIKNSEEQDNRSTDTSLSELTINGKKITPVDKFFQLEVGNYLEKIEISATVSDNKASISGVGSKEIKVGENSFEIIVTAEKGNTETYIVKVIRNEYNNLSDLDEILKLNKDSEIRITNNDKISKEQLDKIIKSKNKIILTKLSEENKKIYSWILDGTKIKSIKEFNPDIIISESDDEIEKAINYANGIYIDFSKLNDIPEEIILRYYVNHKYKDNDKVNLYAYNNNITQLKENIIVKNGYIEFEVTNKFKHVITKAQVLKEEKNEINIWFIISIFSIALIILGIIYILLTRNKKLSNLDNISNSKDISHLEVISNSEGVSNLETVSNSEDIINTRVENKMIEEDFLLNNSNKKF